MKQIVILIMGIAIPVLASDDECLEKRIVDGGSADSAAMWSAAEATCTSDAKNSRMGGNALHFHVNVDWKTGEAKYPVGWPRITRSMPKELQDWSGFDYLLFSVYVESSRTNLPATPLGISLYLPDRPRTYHRTLSELKIGRWVDFRIPIQEIAGTNLCTGLQFHISESDYRDGDVVDFWIDQIVLARYVKPFIAEAKLVEQVLMADSKYLEIEIAMFGVKDKAAINAECRIGPSAGVVFKGAIPLFPGRRKYSLPLPKGGLAQGVFDVSVACEDRTVKAGRLKVISSPYQGGVK